MAAPFLAALDQATRAVVARVRGQLPATAPTAASRQSGAIAHYYCCDPNWALCGLDLNDMPPSGHGEQDCVVCADLDKANADCPTCATAPSAA
ncbi:hypothetical protein [Streptomyces sp. 35G-GA-8]|uniref:hypothetical protein n=1 Tax=Streptomyces sp. 35G-GA-8 TaxID=2939434 RepID=UPI00201F6E32|nr:hypothetical protein [Streptomyces sp. 35G-GA-8]MCL7380379.1 hypothetical protein [Streptomyces sp. 35G-GA-8]